MKKSDLLFGIVKVSDGHKVIFDRNKKELGNMLYRIMHTDQDLAEVIFNTVMCFVEDNISPEGIDELMGDIKKHQQEKISQDKDLRELISKLEKTANGIKS